MKLNTSRTTAVAVAALTAIGVFTPTEARAGWVKAEAAVGYIYRRSHQQNKSADYGDAQASASWSGSSGRSGYGYGHEWWELSGNQYNRRNYTYAKANGKNVWASANAWHSNFLGPQSPDFQPFNGSAGMDGDNGTVAIQDAQYFDNLDGTIRCVLQEAFLQVDAADIEDPLTESVGARLNFVVGTDESTVGLTVRQVDGLLQATVDKTGVFAGMDVDLRNNGANLYSLTIAPNQFQVVGDYDGETYLDSMVYTGQPVPEPATLIGLGALALGIVRRRKR